MGAAVSRRAARPSAGSRPLPRGNRACAAAARRPGAGRSSATVARLVGEQLACDRCAYAEADREDQLHDDQQLLRGLPPLHGRMAMSDLSAETVPCVRPGEPFVITDAFADERVLPQQRDIYERTGITAVVCVPLHRGGPVRHRHGRAPGSPTGLDRGRDRPAHHRRHRASGVGPARAAHWMRCATRSATGCSSSGDGRDLARRRARRYLDVDPAACEMLGYARAEHLDLRIADVVPPDSSARGSRRSCRRCTTGIADRGVRTCATGTAGRSRWSWSCAPPGTGRCRRSAATSPRAAPRSSGRSCWSASGRPTTGCGCCNATAALSAAATPEQVGAIVIAQLRQLLDVESGGRVGVARRRARGPGDAQLAGRRPGAVAARCR